jgi:pyruvate formate lyase activating enzyme
LLIEGALGWCRTRTHRQGALFTLIYGSISSLSLNPIEKKPLYHFHPGTRALTAGSWGCNFGCPWCQNWRISKKPPPPEGRFLSPEAFIEEALRTGCQGTSISFNEPTLSLEWSLDVFQLAKSRGLYNTYVSNGYMTQQALHLLAEAGLDAMNVDIKGGARAARRFCKGILVDRVWDRCRQAIDLGLHLEITTLVIPGVNEDKRSLARIAGRICDDLGADTPWHVSRYHPAYRFRASPTPLKTLEAAREIGLKAGLNYVYLGNVPAHPANDTYCPQCGERLIQRMAFGVLDQSVQDGRCPQCGQPIPGKGYP